MRLGYEGLAEKLDAVEQPVSWWLLLVSVAGFFLTFPLWLLSVLSDWMMLGVTLTLSWAALWYAAFLAIEQTKHAKELRDQLEGILQKLESVVDRIDVAIDMIGGRYG